MTLHLRILRRRSDGHHDVRIALAPVGLYDRLSVTLGGEPGVRLRVDGAQPLGPERENLLVRAATAFQEALGAPLALSLRLEKRIPVGAGLGGGSGNAAALLVALERWHGHPLGAERLHALAARLGADVPFFLAPSPAWAEGRGERLLRLRGLPALELLVVKPPFAIATGSAYGAVVPEQPSGAAAPPEPDVRTLTGVVAGLHNGFEAALLPHYPQLGAIKAALQAAGALGALLSGSGSAVFGVFGTAAHRDAAQSALTDRAHAAGWALLPCRTLQAHRYDLVF